MKKYFLLLLILFSLSGFAQSRPYSEKEIYFLFKKSIVQKDKGKISTPSNPWLICNNDSLFYLNDTVRITSNTYNSNKLPNCCDYIAWTFYKKDQFILNQLQLCKEPTTSSVTKNNDHFMLKLKSADNYLLLSIFNRNKYVESFKILSITNFKQDNTNLTSTAITLVRIK